VKFGLIADCHLAGYTQDRLIENLPERLYLIKNVMYSVAEYCKLHSINRIVIAGDLLHGKSIMYALAMSVLVDYFNTFKSIEHIIIDGNHDLSSRGDEAISALKSLDAIKNVRRITKEYESIDGVMFVPYSTKMLQIIKQNSSPYLVTHVGLNEGVLSSGASIVSDLSVKDLIGKYDTVLMGHYHKPQQIIRGDIRAYYVGSPVQLDWGEKHEEKRFLIVDTDSRVIESVQTTGYKKYFEFKVTNDNKELALVEAKKLQSEGHNVRFLKEDKDVNIDDIQDFVVIDKSEKELTDRGITSSMSLEDKLKRYAQVKEVPDEVQSVYLDVAKKIIEQASKELE